MCLISSVDQDYAVCSGVPRVSGARGEDENWRPLPSADWQAPKALSLAIGGSGAEPQTPTLLGAFGCKWNPFLNSVNTIFNL